MKLTCTQENLAKGINVVANAASQDTTLPVLSNILIRAQRGSISLAATNLEIGISCVVGGRVEKEGALTVPAKLFSQYINSITDEQVILSVKDNTLSISSDKHNSTIPGISAEEFPLIPEVKDGTKFSLAGEIILEAVKKTNFATALDNSRPEIAGLFLSIDKNQLIVAATDGYRLAEFREKIKLDVAKKQAVIIPTKTLVEVARIISGRGNQNVKLAISENQIKLEIEDIIVSSRLVDGKYPDYSQIIPSSYSVEAEVGKEDFMRVIKTASLFSKEGVNDVVVSLNTEKGYLQCSASSSDIGSSQGQVAAKAKGNNAEMTFNHRYLIEGANAIDATEMLFAVSGKAGPGVIKAVDDERYIYIVMPIKR